MAPVFRFNNLMFRYYERGTFAGAITKSTGYAI